MSSISDKSSAPTVVDKTLIITSENENSKLNTEDLQKQFHIKSSSDEDFYGKLSILAEGGVGMILKGTDSNLGREVAVKVLRPEKRENPNAVKRFIREARATAQIEHPNIVPIHELGIHPELGVYFTMKKIGGEPLNTVIQHLQAGLPEYTRQYSLSQLMHIFTDVGNGIAYAHSKGIIHRDLKPDNIFIGSFGEVLVIDWGLVRNIDASETEKDGYDTEKNESEINIDIENESELNLTKEGHISGTPYYMSPEQVRGENSKIDHRSDIYTLGVILYQMLTLRLPFEGKSTIEIMKKVAKGDFTPPRQAAPQRRIPMELEAICMKAMAHSPKERYQNVNDLLKDIYNYFDDFPVSAVKHSLLGRFWKLCMRHKIMTATSLAILLTVTAALSLHEEFMKLKYGPLYSTTHKTIKQSISDIDNAAMLLKQGSNTGINNSWDNVSSTCSEAAKRADENMKLALLLLKSIPPEMRKSPELITAYKTLINKQINFYKAKNDIQKVKELKQILIEMEK